ncbi:MAG: carboxypeptidase regulatory-like domain-containing protein [Bdellovibrionales bacterium]|nr:carboxypeptidase regulatory-like domain-containing protein [Bdellovibrionales bacterium]
MKRLFALLAVFTAALIPVTEVFAEDPPVPQHEIRGKITLAGGPAGLSGVTVSDPVLGNRTTNSAGEFSYGLHDEGTPYNIGFSKPCYSISPSGAAGTVGTGDVVLGANATELTYSISGTVTNSETASGVAGVSVGGSAGSTTTNASGNFTLSGLDGHLSYSLTFSKSNYVLNPSSTSVSMSCQNKVVNSAGYQVATVSGRIYMRDHDQSPLIGAVLDFTHDSNPAFNKQAVTDTNGEFEITQVRNGDYEVEVTKELHVFRELFEPNPLHVEGVDITDVEVDAEPVLDTKQFVLWNGFINIYSYLELINTSSTESLTATITLRDIEGNAYPPIQVAISPLDKLDLAVNEMQGFAEYTYGMLEIDFSHHNFDGGIAYYRQQSSALPFYDFAFLVPFANRLKGTAYVTYNKINPPGFLYGGVLNWVSVVNLHPTQAKIFTLNQYDRNGVLSNVITGDLEPFERIDLPGFIPGGDELGMNEVVAQDPDTPFILANMRYGANNPDGNPTEGYSFGFPLLGVSPSAKVIHAPISRGSNALNYVELANGSSQPLPVTVKMFGNNGVLLATIPDTLQPHAQKHYDASSVLPPGGSGLVRVEAANGGALLGQSMYYFIKSNGRIASMYGSPLRSSYTNKIQGSWNLYLNMSNWLRIFNIRNVATPVTLRIPNQFGGMTVKNYTLAPRSGIDLGLHETYNYGTQLNAYGPLEIETPTDGAVFTEMLRLRNLTPPWGSPTDPDFAMPTYVR